MQKRSLDTMWVFNTVVLLAVVGTTDKQWLQGRQDSLPSIFCPSDFKIRVRAGAHKRMALFLQP